MRERAGWKCWGCERVVLEYRRKRAERCPACGEEMGVGCPRIGVVQFDASDFPKKPRSLPGQMDLFETTQAQLAAERDAQDEPPNPFTVED